MVGNEIMIFFSHRGANTLRVQNTVEAFSLAHAQGARCFELDIHLLKDGNLAVHHDYSLLQTAGVDVALKTLTRPELQQISLNNPFTVHKVHVPVLEEVLPVCMPGLELLNIELKNDGNVYPGIEEKVLQFLPKELLPKILFSSFDYETLARLRALAPQIRIGQLTRKFKLQEILNLRGESVHINYTRFSASLAQICHAHGIKIYCYTVNDLAVANKLAKQGADGFFTDVIHRFVL